MLYFLKAFATYKNDLRKTWHTMNEYNERTH